MVGLYLGMHVVTCESFWISGEVNIHIIIAYLGERNPLSHILICRACCALFSAVPHLLILTCHGRQSKSGSRNLVFSGAWRWVDFGVFFGMLPCYHVTLWSFNRTCYILPLVRWFTLFETGDSPIRRKITQAKHLVDFDGNSHGDLIQTMTFLLTKHVDPNRHHKYHNLTTHTNKKLCPKIGCSNIQWFLSGFLIIFPMNVVVSKEWSNSKKWAWYFANSKGIPQPFSFHLTQIYSSIRQPMGQCGLRVRNRTIVVYSTGRSRTSRPLTYPLVI